jgi:hypothetical protein
MIDRDWMASAATGGDESSPVDPRIGHVVAFQRRDQTDAGLAAGMPASAT